MPVDRLGSVLATELAALEAAGTRKGAEAVTRAWLPAQGSRGPRVLLEGEGDRPFLRMNSNGYLGLAQRAELIAAEEVATRRYGVGPGAVRFISGTCSPHVELEAGLARFHGREAAMLFGSAYAAVMGVLPALVTSETAIVSDELNHSCIIQATRLAQPARKLVYPHLDLHGLEAALETAARECRRALVVSDGVFSMRGDHAPLDRIAGLVRAFDERFAENAVLVVDDSHGVGALGARGRGSEEASGGRADLLVATLGKALGVNGGYVVADAVVIEFLRERSPFYVYSNPITPGEAAAAAAGLAILDSGEGRSLLVRLRERSARLRQGLAQLGFETLPGEHPVVPLLIRDTARTQRLVAHLRAHGVLATDLAYPVVPRGEEEIRFQLGADHSEADVEELLAVLALFGPDRNAPAA